LEDQDAILKIKHFRVGDVIESVAGLALGTIATYDPVTGIGTLTGNSANNLAAGVGVRVDNADLALASQAGRILKSEVIVTAGQDEPVAAYTEGFFIEARVLGATTASKLELGALEPTPGEMRLR